MNKITWGYKIENAIDKTFHEWVDIGIRSYRDTHKDDPPPEKLAEIELTARQHAQRTDDRQMELARRVCRRGIVLTEMERNERGEASNLYFITIRPPHDNDWDKWKSFVDKLLDKKCFQAAVWTHEQKGTDPLGADRGFGFHVTQKSKSEVERDIASTLRSKDLTGIVKAYKLVTKTDLTNVTAYITDYASEDGHKQLTKTPDAEWREARGLQPLFFKGQLSSLGLA
jgi:hypothetical protein